MRRKQTRLPRTLSRAPIQLLYGLVVLGLPLVATAQIPLGTAFTYQGHLKQGSSPANGTFDFEFNLYDDPDPVVGSIVASPVVKFDVDVANGLFSVELDFGDVFGDDARWLEIAVRRDGSDPFTVLSPLQPLTPVPFALYTPEAGYADNADLLDGLNSTDFVLTSSGMIAGPASSTDNAIVRFDGTTGELVQNSGVTIDDGNNLNISSGSVTAGSFSGEGTGLTGTASSLNIGGNAATASTANNLSCTGCIGTVEIDTSKVQRRITGACASDSSIRAVNSDGSVSCETDDVGVSSCNACDPRFLQSTGDTATGDYIFDAGTFSINSANNRVGIRTTSPVNALDVNGYIVGRGVSLARSNPERGALFFGVPGDFNLALYNNLSNLDGEGSWDGTKWNVLSGLNIKVGSGGAKTSAMFISSAKKIGIGTSAPNATLDVYGNDGLLFTGTYGSGTIPAQGAGTRLMWYPKKAAFRAGNVNDTQWDDSNIGDYSAAMGRRTTASGFASTALGNSTIAVGSDSAAMGFDTTADGPYSTAMGYGTTTIGEGSLSMGYRTTAGGHASAAMGWETNTSGWSSTAMGFYTTAQPYASLVIGRYNVTSGSTFSWVSTDPVFVIGNGTGDTNRSNALTVLKNGDLTIAGSASKPGGGSWADSSDLRLKQYIAPLDGKEALEKISQLRGILYEWIHPEEHSAGVKTGFLAQEVEMVFPDWVEETEAKGRDGELLPAGEKAKALSFPHDFNAYLIEAIKEQQRTIEGLQVQIDTLKAIVCLDHPEAELCR